MYAETMYGLFHRAGGKGGQTKHSAVELLDFNVRISTKIQQLVTHS